MSPNGPLDDLSIGDGDFISSLQSLESLFPDSTPDREQCYLPIEDLLALAVTTSWLPW